MKQIIAAVLSILIFASVAMADVTITMSDALYVKLIKVLKTYKQLNQGWLGKNIIDVQEATELLNVVEQANISSGDSAPGQ